MKTYKIYLVLLALLSSFHAAAQFKSAELTVSGLTCSMCSLATEKALRTLDFVADVQPDLNRNLFMVSFKAGKDVSMQQIREKVEGAGFSVYSLVATYHFSSLKIENNTRFTYAGMAYEFVSVTPQTLNGDVKIIFVDKGFVGEDQYKKMLKSGHYKGIETNGNGKGNGSLVYHVSL